VGLLPFMGVFFATWRVIFSLTYKPLRTELMGVLVTITLASMFEKGIGGDPRHLLLVYIWLVFAAQQAKYQDNDSMMEIGHNTGKVNDGDFFTSNG